MMIHYFTVNLENQIHARTKTKICSDKLPYPIDSDAICEAQLLKQSYKLPENGQMSLLFAKNDNVYPINFNLWLITVSDPLSVKVKYKNKEIKLKIIKTNKLWKSQP